MREHYKKINSRKSKNHSSATNVQLEPYPAETPLPERNGLQHGILLHQCVERIPQNTLISIVIKSQLRNNIKSFIQKRVKIIHQPLPCI